MGATIESFKLTDHVRMPTDEEVEFFRENGWAYLPGLVSPELATELLAHVKSVVGLDYDELPRDADGVGEATIKVKSFALRAMPRLEDEFLRSFDECSEMGRAGHLVGGILSRMYPGATAWPEDIFVPGGSEQRPGCRNAR